MWSNVQEANFFGAESKRVTFPGPIHTDKYIYIHIYTLTKSLIRQRTKMYQKVSGSRKLVTMGIFSF